MSNPFKKLNQDRPVPPDLRKKVMDEIATLSLAADISRLFTLNYGAVFQEVFKKKKKKPE